jgi:hypothetical protein
LHHEADWSDRALQQHQGQPPSELESDARHPSDFHKPATLVETNRADILTVDRRHHHAFACSRGPLAQGGDQRSPLFGDVPTFAEKGYPQMYARAWWGIVAPAGTPGDVIEKLNIGLNRVIRDPQFQEKRMLPQGLDPAGTSPAAFAELIREDAKRWAKVIELAGIRPE